jgi:hypothetical protein
VAPTASDGTTSTIWLSVLVITSRRCHLPFQRRSDQSGAFSAIGLSSGNPFQPILVMESTQDGLGHNLLINRKVVSAQFGPLLASP